MSSLFWEGIECCLKNFLILATLQREMFINTVNKVGRRISNGTLLTKYLHYELLHLKTSANLSVFERREIYQFSSCFPLKTLILDITAELPERGDKFLGLNSDQSGSFWVTSFLRTLSPVILVYRFIKIYSKNLEKRIFSFKISSMEIWFTYYKIHQILSVTMWFIK